MYVSPYSSVPSKPSRMRSPITVRVRVRVWVCIWGLELGGDQSVTECDSTRRCIYTISLGCTMHHLSVVRVRVRFAFCNFGFVRLTLGLRLGLELGSRLGSGLGKVRVRVRVRVRDGEGWGEG